MTLNEIRQMPTTLMVNGQGTHESVLRAFAIVGKVREMCELEVPHRFMIEVIDDLASSPAVETKFPSRDDFPYSHYASRVIAKKMTDDQPDT